MRDLTERQKEVLRFIRERARETGFPPTIREIGEAMDIHSTNGVNDHLKALERKGYLSREESKSRGRSLTADAERELGGRRRGEVARSETLSVPPLGRIAAGDPIEAIENADEHIEVDPSLLGGFRHARGVFGLRVQGDSMIGDGILDGDVIFVRPSPEAHDGEIVAAWVDGAATVKRIYRKRDHVVLEPSNPLLSPILVRGRAAREMRVLGRVIGLFRNIE